ncbi:mucin-5AC-like [Aphidius gifuensis]|uniref:mucin-5AC-like n=1 Tax=Aphidius gifuensis TaxID=684658 RepID=UPI001CDC65B4|nr:mucin-5AC-like [Aphidius gifuensis]
MRMVEIFIVVIVLLVQVLGRPQQIKSGCWYEGKRFEESSMVNTTEPCLRCRCLEGSLRCRLRVCPRIPNPPPVGCVTRIPHENACCAELVCRDYHVKEKARESNVAVKLSKNDGCIWEGVHYAPGSAMMGSRRCEYCYCISNERRCVRPRCLLPLPGCTPIYAPYSCCPIAYNCSHATSEISTPMSANGCHDGEHFYEEGKMVRDRRWKSMCDNCFCAMGSIRCVPLACAPPLRGCKPIVLEGQCCPSTYNCSGSIAVKATQNYGSYAFVSKDYAKFRKETNFLSLKNNNQTNNCCSTFEGRSHRDDVPNELPETTVTTIIIPESSLPITETIFSTFETETMNNEIPTENIDYSKSTMLPNGSIDDTTMSTINDDSSGIVSNVESSTIEMISSGESTVKDDTDTTIHFADISTTKMDKLVSMNPKSSTISQTSTTSSTPATLKISSTSTTPSSTSTTNSPSSTASQNSTIVESTTTTTLKTSKTSESPSTTEKSITPETTTSLTTVNTSSITTQKSQTTPDIIFETSIPTSDHNKNSVSIKVPVTGLPTTIIMPDDIFIMNVTLKTNVSIGVQNKIQGVTVNPIRPDVDTIEKIVNITNRKKGQEFGEYDYSEPTLPPSLPNVRIIPFVAADALVKNEEASSPVTAYPLGSVGLSPELRTTDIPSRGNTGNFYDIVTQENRFSPPFETQGGFVPRQPSYFESSYHSTDLNLEIGTGVTVVPGTIKNPHRKNDDITSLCHFEGREYQHGEMLPSSGHCIICICYYGQVACSDEKCTPVKFGCRRIQDSKICCGQIICDSNESPTVVLDRADAASSDKESSIVEHLELPDPFRDVIKTEPAPDLPSLIEDMIPFFSEHGTSITTTTSSSSPPLTTITTPSSLENSNIININNYDSSPDQISITNPPNTDIVYGDDVLFSNKFDINNLDNNDVTIIFKNKF